MKMLAGNHLLLVCLLLYFVELKGQYNYTHIKYHSGRRVCTTTKEVNKPIKVTEPYSKPVYKRFTRKCENDQMCNGIKLVYETVERVVYKPNIVKVPMFVCCPGWMDEKKPSHGCNEPWCTQPCQNGGTCSGPHKCVCLPGYTGKYCENDLDECIVEKPCDHFCFNTKGSYYCTCKDSFRLQADKQSCRKDDDDTNNTAFEAEDLDYDLLDKRVMKLEKMMGMDDSLESVEVNIVKMKSQLDVAEEDIKRLEHKLKELENRQPRTHKLKNRYHQKFQRFETDSSKKQRNNINA